MDLTVELALCAERRLTIDASISVAAIGGVASGQCGGRRNETILTVRAMSRLVSLRLRRKV